MKVHLGDCLEVLRAMESGSVDSLVTDPPAGISFMNKEWDGDKGGRDGWVSWMTEVMGECLRVLKPGAHALVWALPRTSHWTATAIEDAGFDVRDIIMHLFGTGFPKSLSIGKAIDKEAGAEREVLGLTANARPNRVGKETKLSGKQTIWGEVTLPQTPEASQWEGWGTALKPACEHWILARKPLSEKTVAKNVLRHGTGGINVDACRVGTGNTIRPNGTNALGVMNDDSWIPKSGLGGSAIGRYPANLVLDEDAAQALDAQSGVSDSRGGLPKLNESKSGFDSGLHGGNPKIVRNDTGGASRFFYVAKASRTDRNSGLEDREPQVTTDGRTKPIDNPYNRGDTKRLNTHPTVKNTALMEYLITLVTPPGGTVLDPFAGSGSTGVAAKRLGFGFVGIEREEEYHAIASRRLDVAN